MENLLTLRESVAYVDRKSILCFVGFFFTMNHFTIAVCVFYVDWYLNGSYFIVLLFVLFRCFQSIFVSLCFCAIHGRDLHILLICQQNDACSFVRQRNDACSFVRQRNDACSFVRQRNDANSFVRRRNDAYLFVLLRNVCVSFLCLK